MRMLYWPLRSPASLSSRLPGGNCRSCMESAASNKRSFLRAERASAPENLRDLWRKKTLSVSLSRNDSIIHLRITQHVINVKFEDGPRDFLIFDFHDNFLFKVNHVPSPLRVHLQSLLLGRALRRYSRRRGSLLQHGPARLVYDPRLFHSWGAVPVFLFSRRIQRAVQMRLPQRRPRPRRAATDLQHDAHRLGDYHLRPL